MPALQQAAQRGLVELGGCIVEQNQPTQRCLDCSHGWVEPAKVNIDTLAGDSMAMLHKIQHGIDHLVEQYGAACIAHGQNPRGTRRDMLACLIAMEDRWARYHEDAKNHFKHAGASDDCLDPS